VSQHIQKYPTRQLNNKTMEQKKPLVPKKYLLTFILITSLFALWGFANDITNPMVAAFQTVMELSAAKASMIQFAFYGGYATMAIPAALFIRKYSYKSGILLGLGLYAFGAFLFIPAAEYQEFTFFCLSLYILTFGLAFLETTANPFILSLGDKETSTRRLNMAQAFNPVGSLSGMAVASFIVLPFLQSDARDAAGQTFFHTLSDMEKAAIRLHDLAVIRDPYVALGLVVLCVFVIIAITKMPKVKEEEAIEGNVHTVKQTLSNLWNNKIYRNGVFSQMFYVGAQIMVWTFIIQYADNLGIDKATAQRFNIVAMSLNLGGRFIGTYIMKFVNTRKLLMIFGIGASVCTFGAITINGIFGLYSLVLISLFMSIMFPSIYGIALENVDTQDTKLGAAFLVMAIVGGALMPPLQGMIIDMKEIMGMPAVNVSFVLPFICFLIIIAYGRSAYKMKG
jgi:FHS family L-fucose permease-like MFS transporter